MFAIATIWFLLYTIILIASFITAWYLYAIRDNQFADLNFASYMWNRYTFYMWLITVLLILYPLTLIWFIIALYYYTAQLIVRKQTQVFSPRLGQFFEQFRRKKQMNNNNSCPMGNNNNDNDNVEIHLPPDTNTKKD